MAAATSPATKSSEAAPAARGRKKLLLAVIPCVLAAVAAWFMFLGPGAVSAEEVAPEAPELGEVVALDPITMNLADGRLLKVGVALQVVLEPKEAEVTGSVALDETISFLGEHTYEQLSNPAARAATKKELGKRVSERYHGDVVDIYFTEFVMQ